MASNVLALQLEIGRCSEPCLTTEWGHPGPPVFGPPNGVLVVGQQPHTDNLLPAVTPGGVDEAIDAFRGDRAGSSGRFYKRCVELLGPYADRASWTNATHCRGPHYSREQLVGCAGRQYLRRVIELIEPRALLLLGGAAVEAYELQWTSINPPALRAPHPAWLFRFNVHQVGRWRGRVQRFLGEYLG